METRVVLKEMNLKEVVNNLRTLGVEDVRVKIEDEKNTHIEFSFRYNKDRKRYYLSSNPIKVSDYMVAMELFGGSYRNLSVSPIARKSKKQEQIARNEITVELLESVLREIENNKR